MEMALYHRKIIRELQEQVARLLEHFRSAAIGVQKKETQIRRYYQLAIEAKDEEAQIIRSRLEV